MCQIVETVEKDVCCSVRPSEGEDDGTGMWRVRVRCPCERLRGHSEEITRKKCADLGAPQTKRHCATGTIADFLGKEVWIRVLLLHC